MRATSRDYLHHVENMRTSLKSSIRKLFCEPYKCDDIQCLAAARTGIATSDVDSISAFESWDLSTHLSFYWSIPSKDFASCRATCIDEFTAKPRRRHTNLTMTCHPKHVYLELSSFGRRLLDRQYCRQSCSLCFKITRTQKLQLNPYFPRHSR